MSTIIAMCLFALTMSISPGPVNLISLSASSQYGFRKTLPFVSGATIGFIVLLTSLGLGLSNFVIQEPLFYKILKYLGVAFIAYMGYKTISATAEIELKDEKLPRFIHGFLTNLLNPKAWIACLSGISAFNLGNSTHMLFIFIALYFFICYPSVASWAFLGSRMHIFLKLKKNLILFNKVMGGLLISTALYLLFVH